MSKVMTEPGWFSTRGWTCTITVCLLGHVWRKPTISWRHTCRYMGGISIYTIPPIHSYRAYYIVTMYFQVFVEKDIVYIFLLKYGNKNNTSFPMLMIDVTEEIIQSDRLVASL